MRNFIVIVSMLLSATALVYADSSIKMVTYFPIPYASYNRVDTNHRLDIGLSEQSTTLTLGSDRIPDVNRGLNVQEQTNINVRTFKINAGMLILDEAGQGFYFPKTATEGDQIPLVEFQNYGGLSNIFGNSLNVQDAQQYHLKIFDKEFPSGMNSTCRDRMEWKRLKLGPDEKEDLYLTCGLGDGRLCTPGETKTVKCGCNGNAEQTKTCRADARSYELTECPEKPCPSYCYWDWIENESYMTLPTGGRVNTYGAFWCKMDACQYHRLKTYGAVYESDLKEEDKSYMAVRPPVNFGDPISNPREPGITPIHHDPTVDPGITLDRRIFTTCPFSGEERKCMNNPVLGNDLKLASYASNSECNTGLNVDGGSDGGSGHCPEATQETEGTFCNVAVPRGKYTPFADPSPCDDHPTQASGGTAYYWMVRRYKGKCSYPYQRGAGVYWDSF